ncbi:hypothetical protein T10_1833 [Trichinella papuae]|uniref:Uncharacterized protein n=1 Tax=Trichinella papuae TaxID=268474 RepID=A0A0V1MEP2_9BILA|nr:hypothetical protein T10_1833 [Trichinella papuae]
MRRQRNPRRPSVHMTFGKNFHALIQVVHLSKVGNYAEFELYFVAQALLDALQFRLSLPGLCCFHENMTELSPELRKLPCE